MPDAELLTALKQAKSKKMFFAFIPKGGSDGQLIVAKAKIPPKQIADAKKAIGGGNAVTGKCFGGDGGAIVFQVAKAAPPALAAAVKKVAKRDTGLTIDPDFQLAGDADAEEATSVAAAVIAPAAPGPAKPPVAAAASAAPAPQPSEPQALVTNERNAASKAALDDWIVARQGAIDDLKALAKKVAATKHGSAVGVLKEINTIITKLPVKPAPNQIDKLEDFVRNDEIIADAEKVPAQFHNLKIREPLLKALAAMKN